MALARGIAAVMLDLDGTLLDTIPDLAAAAERMLTGLDLPPCSQEEIRTFVGKGIPNLVERCLRASAGEARAPALQEQALALFQDVYFEESGRRSSVYPGVLEGLAQFRAMAPRLPDRRKVAVAVEPTVDELASMREAGFDYFQIHFRLETAEARVAEWSRFVGAKHLWLAPKLPPTADVSPAVRSAMRPGEEPRDQRR